MGNVINSGPRVFAVVKPSFFKPFPCFLVVEREFFVRGQPLRFAVFQAIRRNYFKDAFTDWMCLASRGLEEYQPGQMFFITVFDNDYRLVWLDR